MRPLAGRLICLAVFVTRTALARPAPPRPAPSFRFASGTATAGIPVSLVANGLVFFRAAVNGHTGWFILDNATQGFIIDRDFAAANSLGAEGDHVARGGGAAEIHAGIARDVTITLPGLTLTHRNLVAIPLKAIEPAVGHTIDGIIGSRLFDDFVVRIDYARHRFSVSTPDSYRPAAEEKSFPVVIDEHGFPFLDATLTLPGGAPLTVRFLIDGGANTFVDIYKPFADANRLPPPEMRLLDEPGTSTGGATPSKLGRATEIRLGPYAIARPTVTFSEDTEGLMADRQHAGLIGTEFLERFTVVFDNPHRRIWLAPNRHYGDPVEDDASGLRVQAEGPDFHKFVVRRIVPGSPAAEAGVAPGDVIESIEGRTTTSLTLTELRDLFRSTGARRFIGISRGSHHLDFTLRLRPAV